MAALLNSTGVLYGNSTQQDTAAYDGFRNLIDNGDFRVDNKYDGAAQAIASGASSTVLQGIDRWFAGAYNNVTVHGITAQRIAYNDTGGDTETTSQYGLQLTCTNFQTGNIVCGQRIEGVDCVKYAGRTMTLSWTASSPTGGPSNYQWTVMYPTTKDTWYTGTSFAANKTYIAGTSYTGITTSPTRFSATFTMPVVANAQLGLEIQFSFVPTAVSQSLIITKVQLEPASVQSPFQAKPLSYELLRCARFLPAFWGYYYNTAGTAVGAGSTIGIGVATGATTASYQIPLKVPTRVPVIGIGSTSAYPIGANNSAGTTSAITGIVLSGSTVDNITFSQTALISGSYTLGNPLRMMMNNSVTQKMWFYGAEL